MAKLVYEKDHIIYASEKNIPTANDKKVCDREVLEGHALVYSKKVDGAMKVFISDSGIPADGDKDIIEVQAEADAKAKAEKQAECGVDGGHTPEDTNDDGKCDECEKEIVKDEDDQGGDEGGDQGGEDDEQ